MSTCPEVLPLSSVALFVLAPYFTPNSLMVFTRAEPMARASIPNWAAVEQIHSPAFFVALLISDLANTEKGRIQTKVSFGAIGEEKDCRAGGCFREDV